MSIVLNYLESQDSLKKSWVFLCQAEANWNSQKCPQHLAHWIYYLL